MPNALLLLLLLLLLLFCLARCTGSNIHQGFVQEESKDDNGGS